MLKQNTEYKRFVWELSNLLENKREKIIFMCIGTSKVIGDSVGPIVGSILKNKINKVQRIKVIGDYQNNLCYESISNKIDSIRKLSKNNLVIVIDSALYKTECIGKVFIENRGLQYGAGLKKGNDYIGNVSIKAVVGKDFDDNIKNFNVLKNVSFSKVIEVANIISNGIVETINS